MNKRSFYRWLQAIKKYDQATCNSILSSCQKIEKYYGNLDEIYDKDKCKNLKQELKELNSKNNIPIDVDMHVETAAFRNALNLYLEFKENQILQDIMTMEDVTPDEHDGSYELVRETVESFSKIDINKIDVSDLDLLYFMAIRLWKGGVEYRIKKIEESNLNSIEKNRLKTVFQ